MDQGFVWPHRFQHHIVVQIPVQHRRQLQIAQAFQRQFDGAGHKPDAISQINHCPQRCATQRRRELSPQIRQIHVQPVMAGHHCQGCQTAFCNLSLADQADAPLPRGPQPRQIKPSHRRLTANTGSNSHCSKVRCSVVIRAVTCIPGSRRSSRPNAAMLLCCNLMITG